MRRRVELGLQRPDVGLLALVDLVERGGEISALLNCGGFDKAFAGADISEYGLLTDHAKATEVQRLLRAEYPNEHHADCDVWAIWQMITFRLAHR